MSVANPLIIAHRGASGSAPENTMKSFRLAYTQGADGVELDVFLTLDGELVITHDEHLERLTGHRHFTRKLSLKELKGLDFGEGEQIPTLHEFLEEFGPRFSIINIEIKSTGFVTDGIEQKLADLICEHKIEDKILVSSFNPLHLVRIKRILPTLKTGFLTCPDTWYAPVSFWSPVLDVYSINFDQNHVSPEKIAQYKEKGKKIWLWTVNSEIDMDKWLRSPVDAMITNYPDKLKNIIQKLKR